MRDFEGSSELAKRVGEVVHPHSVNSQLPPGTSSTRILRSEAAREASAVLASHLFAEGDRNVPGVSYAVAYRLSELTTGGDIVDVYQFNNGAVALSIADISGKGTQASIHAALIKYGLRAYCSHGLTAETVMRALARLYLENCTFEEIESFASVFFGVVDRDRRTLTYANAGHEPVLLVHPHLEPRVLAPTAPIIGVFDDQHHLFTQRTVELWPGSVLVATTDGITEARSADGEFFGMHGFYEFVKGVRNEETSAIVDGLAKCVEEFAGTVWRDDVAILAARFA
ncbi:MAG: serine/threonine-protein phosphatase [Candidatus Eremiobacteraeota bacterium]|nr:serine/threonine-protein phosphatase [Candidatus Eremiobacteraeota bacterium]